MGIAIDQSKALFKAYHRLAENFKFIKGLPSSQFTSSRQAHPCTMIWLYPDNIESGGKCGLLIIIF